MKILIRAVGKMRDPHLSAVCDDYLKRARRHLPVTVEEVDDDEGLLRALPMGAEGVALLPGGQAWDTPAFCRYIEKHMVAGSRGIVFFIGGADGLGPQVVAKAALRLSLSPLTLPHRLARVLLCEQIYRVLSILRGEPYNR